MRIGMVGLGRMGGGMTARLLERGHEVVVFDRDREITELAGSAPGAVAAGSLADLVAELSPPRIVWLMLPAGEPTESTLAVLAEAVSPGDTLLDGGNSRFTDTQRRAAALADRRIDLVDAGTSGGVWGHRHGYCLMVGGPDAAVRRCEPLFRDLAAEGGYAHVGASGAGHFTKMVHNGIEYGMLQAYAEGFELLRASAFDLDLPRIAALWNRGSVVRSWLLELLELAFSEEGADLERVSAAVADSGEGRWTVETAVELGVPAPVIADALFARFRSRQPESYAGRVVSALRRGFGGH
jgi:6-phosphogluconate dehydrogenase